VDREQVWGTKRSCWTNFHQVSSVLEAFVPETRRPLGHGRFATACGSTRAVAPVDVFGDPVRASSWAALEFRPQGRRHDWADSLRRRREPCQEARAELHSPPNHVGCCPILSAEVPARPTAAVTITPSHHQSSPRQVSSPYSTLVYLTRQSSKLPAVPMDVARNNVMHRSRRLCAVTLMLQGREVQTLSCRFCPAATSDRVRPLNTVDWP
jgi:hypothetical protein